MIKGQDTMITYALLSQYVLHLCDLLFNSLIQQKFFCERDTDVYTAHSL